MYSTSKKDPNLGDILLVSPFTEVFGQRKHKSDEQCKDCTQESGSISY